MAWLFITIGSAVGAPTISGTDPEEIPPVDSRQWVTILGSEFQPGAAVAFFSEGVEYLIPTERMEYVGSSAIRVLAGLFPSDVMWEVWVTNPDGHSSNRLTLRFGSAPKKTDVTDTNIPDQSGGWINDGSVETFQLYSFILGENHADFRSQFPTVQPKETLAHVPLAYDDGTTFRIYILNLTTMTYCRWRADTAKFVPRLAGGDTRSFFQTWEQYERNIHHNNWDLSREPLRAALGLQTWLYPNTSIRGPVIWFYVTADGYCGATVT